MGFKNSKERGSKIKMNATFGSQKMDAPFCTFHRYFQSECLLDPMVVKYVFVKAWAVKNFHLLKHHLMAFRFTNWFSQILLLLLLMPVMIVFAIQSVKIPSTSNLKNFNFYEERSVKRFFKWANPGLFLFSSFPHDTIQI